MKKLFQKEKKRKCAFNSKNANITYTFDELMSFSSIHSPKMSHFLKLMTNMSQISC